MNAQAARKRRAALRAEEAVIAAGVVTLPDPPDDDAWADARYRGDTLAASLAIDPTNVDVDDDHHASAYGFITAALNRRQVTCCPHVEPGRLPPTVPATCLLGWDVMFCDACNAADVLGSVIAAHDDDCDVCGEVQPVGAASAFWPRIWTAWTLTVHADVGACCIQAADAAFGRR